MAASESAEMMLFAIFCRPPNLLSKSTRSSVVTIDVDHVPLSAKAHPPAPPRPPRVGPRPPRPAPSQAKGRVVVLARRFELGYATEPLPDGKTLFALSLSLSLSLSLFLRLCLRACATRDNEGVREGETVREGEEVGEGIGNGRVCVCLVRPLRISFIERQG